MPVADTLAKSRASAAALERALADHAARSWQGEEIFLAERFDDARRELDAWADLARTVHDIPPLAGLTMTVKACFDVEGWTTHCASEVLRASPVAVRSAGLVRRLREAGATLVAQTNMTEFAYGALGVNSRFGTPRTPLDPEGARVAGGSSSGAAVAVARGYCDVSVCSDTSGSARIPAAFCGVVGFKPSRGRYPDDGMQWLSPSFDAPGLIASSAALCRTVDAIAAGPPSHDEALSERRIRLALPAWLEEAALAPGVRRDFRDAVAALERSGVYVEVAPLEVLRESAAVAAQSGMIAVEAYRIHREHLDRALESYDPLVGPRLLRGREIPADRYLDGVHRLADCRRRFDAEIAGFDGFLLPTVPISPPRLAELGDTQRYLALNAQAFSFTEFANRLDLPSVSLPIGRRPCGLMITAPRGRDEALLSMAQAVEPVIGSIRHRP